MLISYRTGLMLALATNVKRQCDRKSVCKADRQRNSAHHNEADGPGHVQIEPAPRHEFETEIPIDQPRRASAGSDHRGGVSNRDQHGQTEIGIDEDRCRRVACVEVRGLAQPEINRHQHQSGAVSDRHGERPKPQLRRPYPGERPWMSRKTPNPMTKRPAPIRIWRCHSTRVTSAAKGRMTNSTARKWPADSGQSAVNRARELLSISPAETARRP